MDDFVALSYDFFSAVFKFSEWRLVQRYHEKKTHSGRKSNIIRSSLLKT